MAALTPNTFVMSAKPSICRPPGLSSSSSSENESDVKRKGANDGTDALTPISCGQWGANQFPDKERTLAPPSGQPGTLSSTLSERSNSRGHQRRSSFKLARSRDNSFSSFVGPPTSLSVSTQTSADTISSNKESIQPSRSLKIFVKLPSKTGIPGDVELSSDAMSVLERAAKLDMNGLKDIENRPPSPRPHDTGTAVRLHSEVLENWEDSMRFRFHENPAGAKYSRGENCALESNFRKTSSRASEILAEPNGT